MPKRIQRKRIKGWRMPANCVSIARPGKWGNPFCVGDWVRKGDPGYTGAFRFIYTKATKPEYADETYTRLDTVEKVLEFYRWYLIAMKTDLSELKGKDLACFCKEDHPCHGDVLIELANQEGR